MRYLCNNPRVMQALSLGMLTRRSRKAVVHHPADTTGPVRTMQSGGEVLECSRWLGADIAVVLRLMAQMRHRGFRVDTVLSGYQSGRHFAPIPTGKEEQGLAGYDIVIRGVPSYWGDEF